MPLTPKQKTFADKIAQGASHSQAYREAYRSDGNARTVCTEAYRLARRPEIAAAIKRRLEQVRLTEMRNVGSKIGIFQPLCVNAGTGRCTNGVNSK